MDGRWEGIHRLKGRTCPVCGKPDWCAVHVNAAGHIDLVMCQRVESTCPVESTGGYIHRAWGDEVVKLPPPTTATLIDASALFSRYLLAMTRGTMSSLAHDLGVSVDSLARIGVGWSDEHNAYAFPMRDHTGKVIGIRLRTKSGRKFAVKGSKQGLFMTVGVAPSPWQYIVEGPTDLAALLDMGLYGVGRPCCRGQAEMIRRVMVGKSCCIIADQDAPGLNGAEALRRALGVNIPIIRPPDGVKDVRQWKAEGGTKEDIESARRAACGNTCELVR